MRRAAARGATREQRIENFVRQRDPAVLTNRSLANMIMNPDICDSGDELGRSDKDLDMRRKAK